MIVPYYRKLTLYKIDREFPKFALILVALIYVNVYFRAVNHISVALISIILTPISQYLLTFLTPKKEKYFYQGWVPPVTEKLCRTWVACKPFVRLRKEPSQKQSRHFGFQV